MTFDTIVIIHGGELATDVAQQVAAKKPARLASSSLQVSVQNASERPKTLLDFGPNALLCFVIQTIENAAPTEDVSRCSSLPVWIIDSRDQYYYLDGHGNHLLSIVLELCILCTIIHLFNLLMQCIYLLI